MIKNKKTNSMRLLALLLGVLMVAPLFIYGMEANLPADLFTEKNSDPVNQQEDARIAAEISNLTGVTTEEILTLRKSENTWNEILALLKSDTAPENPASRAALLIKAGLSEALQAELEAMGFEGDKIQAARMLTERVQFQLSEIAGGVSPTVAKTALTGETGNGEEIQQLYEAFDPEKAILLILTLEEPLGSMEAALEEYLLSIQISVELLEYIEDWQTYEVLRNQQLNTLEPITLADIEELMLEKIQTENQNIDSQEPSARINPIEAPELDGQERELLPVIQEVKPVNPSQQVLDEINQLNPNYTTEERLP